jgi:DNA polymerase-3 subunit epsilon
VTSTKAAKHLIDQTVETAKAKTEAEKNMLATIMSELTQGVLICDTVGRILLYNREAQRVLTQVKQPDGLDKPVEVRMNRSLMALSVCTVAFIP